MKTDRFADIIRRKLESIRPEFTEKDWARMQSTLQQANLPQPDLPGTQHHFTGSAWSGQPWLLAAATVSTVMLVAFSVWQRSEINHLRQTVGQLSKHTVNPQKPTLSTPSPTVPQQSDRAVAVGNEPARQSQEPLTPADRQRKEAVRTGTDTVYLTRYVTVPARSQSTAPDGERAPQRSETATEQRYAVTPRTSFPTEQPRRSTNLSTSQSTEPYGASSTSVTSDNTQNSTETSVSANDKVSFTPSAIDKNRKAANRSIATIETSGKPSKSKSQYVAPVSPTASSPIDSPDRVIDPGQPPIVATVETKSPAEANNLPATYELATSRPLELELFNWNKALTRRAAALRPARPKAAPAEQIAPASQPIERFATKFRVGTGGEVDSRMWSIGLLGEAVIRNHWTLGLGLSRATYMSGTFLSAPDFDARTHRDFRQEFARGIDPRRDIWNIDTRMTRLQIPLTLSYRAQLSKSFTLLPTIGTYLNLNNTENVTFYYLEPQRGFDQVNYSKDCPVELINSFTIGTNLEWQRNHWVAQAGPLITIPGQPDPNWQKNTTIGLRARVLYQF